MLDFIEKERDYVTKMLNKTMEKEAGILSEPVSIVLGSKKKFVRPTLTLLSCQAVGGAVNVAWPAALAVELVHNASIVSDDLLDDDAVREMSHEREQFQGPCAGFKIPRLAVRDLAAMKLASLLDMKEAPDEFWTDAQWEELRRKVQERLPDHELPQSGLPEL